MCGRCACTLQPEILSRACQYKDSSGKYRQAQWIPSKVEDIKYKHSCNLGPRSVLPILISGSHMNSDNERIICPMLWGMIPPWNQGDYRKHKLSTHNARLEDLQNSKMYLPPLRQGRRCVVAIEGFYEWKREGSMKQPYYIYAKQEDSIKVEDKSSWSDDWSEETGWHGVQLLKLAGIFNTFKTETGDVHSFSMLTREANKVLSWLHNRTPVFLRTEEEVQSWLGYDETPMEKALENLRRLSLEENTINWHPVSTAVNSVFYQEEDCIKPIKLETKEETKKSPTGLMASWLKGASIKRKSDNTENLEISQKKKTPKKEE